MTIDSVSEIILRDERTPWLNIHSAYDEMPLTIEAFRVLCHFARRANNETKETKTTYKNIGEVCFKATYPNSAPNTLRRRAIKAVSELEGFGLVRKEPWYTDGGDLLGNIFILTHTTSWKLDFDPSLTNNSLVRGVSSDTGNAESTGATDDTEGCDQPHQEVLQDSPRGDAGRTEYKGNPLRESKKVILEGNPCTRVSNDCGFEPAAQPVEEKKSTASQKKTRKTKPKPPVLTEEEIQAFVDLYNQEKPDGWKPTILPRHLTDSLVRNLSLLVQEYGEESMDKLRKTLIVARTHPIWSKYDGMNLEFIYRKPHHNIKTPNKIAQILGELTEEQLANLDRPLTEHIRTPQDDKRARILERTARVAFNQPQGVVA